MPVNHGDETTALVDHFFRHESARLIAALTRRLGMRHLPLVEDALQVAMSRALLSWSLKGTPENPSAWLMRVASNHALDVLRRETRQQVPEPGQLEAVLASTAEKADIPEQELQDSLLRMIFACCDPSVPVESRTALALKTLCGFSVSEIARALVSTDSSIAKRISRAKTSLRQVGGDLADLNVEQLLARLSDVQRVIYLLFNEGYSSSHPDRLIRVELCEEAVRLALMLAEHPLTSGSESSAFLALLLFHSSRLDARLDESGAILLFAEQNVDDWDLRLLREAFRWFEQATQGAELSRYHAEALIAAEHCQGKLSGNTNWSRIVAGYDWLCRISPSPIHQLNRAIAVAHHRGAKEGVECIEQIDDDRLADQYYLLHAARGEMLAMLKDSVAAQKCFRRAWELAPNHAEKELMCRKIDGLV
ncbi:MAG: sigma-70 family RNA polymerase sigma factor [Planctomycetota bacterium]